MLVSSGLDYQRIVGASRAYSARGFTLMAPIERAAPLLKTNRYRLTMGTSAHSGVATPQALDAALSVVVYLPAWIGRATPEYASVETRSSQISRHHKLMPRWQNIR